MCAVHVGRRQLLSRRLLVEARLRGQKKSGQTIVAEGGLDGLKKTMGAWCPKKIREQTSQRSILRRHITPVIQCGLFWSLMRSGACSVRIISCRDALPRILRYRSARRRAFDSSAVPVFVEVQSESELRGELRSAAYYVATSRHHPMRVILGLDEKSGVLGAEYFLPRRFAAYPSIPALHDAETASDSSAFFSC